MLDVNFDGVKYVARLSMNEKKRVMNAGFFWDETLKKFTTHSHQCAYRLIDFADPQTKKVILFNLGLLPLIYDLSRMDWPEKEKPFTHQIDFAKHMLKQRCSYVAGEAGTGKTAACVLAMNAEEGPTIVICPSFLRYNWAEEIKRWSTWPDLNIDIVQNQKHFFDDEANVYILPASLLHIDRIREYFFTGRRFKWVFVDEAHYFKTEDIKRSVSVYGGRVQVDGSKKIWKGFKHITDRLVDLSGTPMPNRPLELFPVLSKHAHHVIDYWDKHKFGIEYCGGRETEWGWDYNGSSNESELHARLTKEFMIVRRLKDCVDLPAKLPPKFIYLEDDRLEKYRESEMQILKTVKVEDIIAAEMARSERFAERVEHATHRASTENKVFVDGGFQFLSELRKINGVRKVPQAIKVIKEILDDLDELVVFAWHTEVVKLLAEGLKKYDPFVITGSTANKSRHNQVKEFQKSKTRNLFLGNIQAVGVGNTLTKACKTLFVEPSYVAGDNEQAINRVFRLTQTREVDTSFLVYPNSMDHMVLNAHQKKTKVIGKVIYGQN